MVTASDAAFESIRAEDLGMPAGVRLPLRFRPGRTWSPLVVSFPHVGLAWPPELRPKPQVDFARNADYQVQTLYDEIDELGVATLEAVWSRLVVDLNRASDDVSSLLVPDHPAPRPRRRPGSVDPSSEAPEPDLDRPSRGVVWARAVGNVPILDGPLPFREFQRRIELFHEPYHRALALLLERRRQRFGFAILLDAHSMPSSVGPDLVIGTLGGSSCAKSIEELAVRALGEPQGEAQSQAQSQAQSERNQASTTLSLRVNEPYRGGEVVRRFGRPAEGLHALQLEVSRALYMDESTVTLWARPNGQRLAQGPSDSPGTSAPGGRESLATLATLAGPRPPSPPPSPDLRALPPPRQARALSELLRRVRCLVRALACDARPSSSSRSAVDRSDDEATGDRLGASIE